jgi:hypothetical protein
MKYIGYFCQNKSNEICFSLHVSAYVLLRPIFRIMSFSHNLPYSRITESGTDWDAGLPRQTHPHREASTQR